MTTQDVVRALLTGSFLLALLECVKFIVTTWRAHRSERSPLSIVTSTNTAAQVSVDILSRTNAELDDENTRIRKLWHEAEDARARDRDAHEVREAKLKGEIEALERSVRELRQRIHALEAQLRSLGDAASSLQSNVKTFKEREFPKE